MRVALYARVSTRQHGQDVETQLQALRLWARQHKHKLVDIYADRGWSGAKANRPELDRLMMDAKQKRFDGVVVTRFDRFARSVKHLISALDDFKSWGVNFISLGESIDTTTPIGKAMFTILGAIAELERSLIRERVQLGVDRARREGRRLGRPHKQSTHNEQVIVAEAIKTKNVRDTARRWGIPRSTLRSIIARAEGQRSPAKVRQGGAGRIHKESSSSRGRLRRGHGQERHAKDRAFKGSPGAVRRSPRGVRRHKSGAR